MQGMLEQQKILLSGNVEQTGELHMQFSQAKMNYPAWKRRLAYLQLSSLLSQRKASFNNDTISNKDYLENQIFLLYCWGMVKNRKRKQVYQNNHISHPIAIFCNIYFWLRSLCSQ